MPAEYDSLLSGIPFYRVHPEYLPFIGERYEEYKILHVGESHYIGQKQSGAGDEYPITIFQGWWDDHVDALYEKYGGWYHTRQIIENYLNGHRHKGHSIFSETIKVFDKVYLGRDNVKINDEESQNYHYFAFMNFFQMPALYNGMKYWDSLLASAEKIGNRELAFAVYEKAAQRSSEVLDSVIDILKPSTVIFTSDSARHAYGQYGGHKSERYIVCSTHPGSPWWNRPIKGYGGRTGKQELERALAALRKV